MFSRATVLCRAAAVLAACAALAAACGESGTITKLAAPTSTSSTTALPESTIPETVPATTVVDTTVPPPDPTVAAPPPADAAVPPPTVPSAPTDGSSTLPGEVVRPPAAWISPGLPQPGSMFENLRDDRTLDGKGQFVALTFDDGPSQYTQQIVDILRFMGVTATFFQIEPQAQARPDLVRGMLFAGMHIGSHSKHHPHLRDVPPLAQIDEVVGSTDALDATFGAGTVKCFRPPYAQYDQHVLDLVAGRGLATAMWSVDTLDWKKPSWTSLVTRLVPGVRDRDVLLFHDGGGDRTQTIIALPWIIQGLKDRGFQFVTVC